MHIQASLQGQAQSLFNKDINPEQDIMCNHEFLLHVWLPQQRDIEKSYCREIELFSIQLCKQRNYIAVNVFVAPGKFPECF